MKITYIKSIIVLAIGLTFQSCQSQVKNGLEEYKFSNGNTQFSYTVENGVRNGPYQAFYETGKLWAEGSYVNGQLTGVFKTYTPEGKLAKEEEFKSGTLMFQKIFWQPIPYDEKNFLFSSEQGFVTVQNGSNIELDSSTPDNIIEEKMNIETGELELHIWSKGQRKLYKKLK